MQSLNIYILAIETSCDDTSCSILKNDYVLSNVISSQKIHELFGGVIPELASRDHQKNIVNVVDLAIIKANISLSQLNAIAVTRGPGLMGSLLVGLSFSKSLAFALNIPLIEVNHMQGHILSHFIKDPFSTLNSPPFPFICLTVSGGHTQLVKVIDHHTFELLGQTIDDAVGEAFDKAAKIIGLTYPGGPLIDKLSVGGNKNRFKFPYPKVNGTNYSFSGIKTAFLYFIQHEIQINENFIKDNIADICASYQNHLIQVLLQNVKKVIKKTGIKNFAIAGGVSANTQLREQVKNLENELNLKSFIPKFEFCTDNAAMIGITAYYKYLKKEFVTLDIEPLSRMNF